MTAMHPWYYLENDETLGVWHLLMFASLDLGPERKGGPVAIFKSLDGYLNKAIPMEWVGTDHARPVEGEVVAKTHPEYRNKVLAEMGEDREPAQ